MARYTGKDLERYVENVNAELTGMGSAKRVEVAYQYGFTQVNAIGAPGATPWHSQIQSGSPRECREAVALVLALERIKAKEHGADRLCALLVRVLEVVESGDNFSNPEFYGTEHQQIRAAVSTYLDGRKL